MTDLEKSEKASAALHEPIIDRAFKDLRENIVSHMEAIAIGDKDSKEDYLAQLQSLKAVKLMLFKYLGYGAVERHKQKQEAFIAKNRQSLDKTGLTRARQ